MNRHILTDARSGPVRRPIPSQTRGAGAFHRAKQSAPCTIQPLLCRHIPKCILGNRRRPRLPPVADPQPIREGHEVGLLGGVRGPRGNSRPVGVDRGDEVDEVVGELAGFVDVEDVGDVKLRGM
jgi:hypothetical protein